MTVKQAIPAASAQIGKLRPSRFGKKTFRYIRLLASYIFLILGACFMLFPLLWMLSASFKPEWQIFTRPPIWIPQEWIQAPGGQENTGINTYSIKVQGKEEEVIRLGRRRYTTVIDVGDIQAAMISVPATIAAIKSLPLASCLSATAIVAGNRVAARCIGVLL